MNSYKKENPLINSIENTEWYNKTTIKVYKKRWLMLGLYLQFCITNYAQYAQYTVVINLMASYYGVSDLDIAWSAMTYMATYVMFSFPGLYVLELLGIRKTLIISIIGMSIGAWIKVIAVNSTRYWFALMGQTLVASFQVFVLPIPSKIAAVWFSDNEVATACSVGVAGPQVGIAMGFLFTPLLVHNGTKEVIQQGLYLSMITTAVFSTIVGILIFFYFEEFPPKPPSLTQLQAAKSRIMTNSTFRKATKNLITNRSFVLFLIVFGVNIGIQMPISVFLNQITLHYYPRASSSDVGLLGALVLSFVIIGALLSGIILNNLRNYRILALLAFALNLGTFLSVCLLYGHVLWLFKLSAALFGFSIGCIFSLGYEVGVELTYPESEEISGGFLSCSYQLIGITLCYFYNLLFESVGFTYANFTLVGVILITDILLLFTDFNLKRQNVVDSVKYIEF